MTAPFDLAAATQAWRASRLATGRTISIPGNRPSDTAEVMVISRDDLAWAQAHIDAARNSISRENLVTRDAPYGRRFAAAVKALISCPTHIQKSHVLGPAQVTIVYPFLLVEEAIRSDDIALLLDVLQREPAQHASASANSGRQVHGM